LGVVLSKSAAPEIVANFTELQMTMIVEERQIAVPAAAQTSAVLREATTRPAACMPKEFLSFRLGGEEYGIDILRVQEIRSYEVPIRIANAPDFIKGVVNLRGVIVPIIDLRLKLACETAEYTGFTVVIVLNVRGRVVGVVVDSVSDVLELSADNIKPAPEMSATVDAGYIIGMGCIKSGEDERLLILTDIEALMGSAEMGLTHAAAH
jgi:purine-binding chemotaxis protein CheW